MYYYEIHLDAVRIRIPPTGHESSYALVYK